MKKMNLPKEAMQNANGVNFWFYDELVKGSRKNWKMDLYELDPVKKVLKADDGFEMDCGYKEYKMIFDDRNGWKIVFEFRQYNDSEFFMVYKDDEDVMDVFEDYEDLAGCCRSAMCYLCERV